MDPPKTATAALTVDDIATLGDAELAEFMKKHRRPNGDFDLPVDGWDKLSKSERDQLAERLKAQVRAQAHSPTACSRPLDLDALDARLRDVSDANNPDPPRHRARRTETPPDYPALIREIEIKAFHDLVEDGGRPLYTIDRLDQVMQNPDEHREMMYPWEFRDEPKIWELYWEGYDGHKKMFRTQLARWKDFRKWQNDNRGIEDDAGFPAYVESTKKLHLAWSSQGEYAKWLAKIAADPSSMERGWDFEQLKRDEQRHYCRERGCHGFPQYASAVKRRLSLHDFTLPFHLHEDPKQQDKLTTWIEYLKFEYWWLDRHTGVIEYFKPAHDKAWQELVDLEVVRPHETPDYLRTRESRLQRQAELDRAWEAVKRAESEAKTVQHLRVPKEERIAMTEAAAKKLNAAKSQLESMERRGLISDFICGTFDYDSAKNDAARQSMLAQWVLEQVPLIEAEMTQSEARDAGSHATKRMKRKLSTDQDDVGKQNAKRHKFVRQELNSHPASGAAVLAEASETHLGPGTVTDQNGAKGS